MRPEARCAFVSHAGPPTTSGLEVREDGAGRWRGIAARSSASRWGFRQSMPAAAFRRHHDIERANPASSAASPDVGRCPRPERTAAWYRFLDCRDTADTVSAVRSCHLLGGHRHADDAEPAVDAAPDGSPILERGRGG